MGQSFLTHDEKSSAGSPSPDLLQFNGGSSSQSKFFGSLSSIKETSLSSSSRSPLEESDSERNLRDANSPSSPQNSELYGTLVPTPIEPGNVSRLREKFMDFDRKQKDDGGSGRNSVISENGNIYKKEVLSDLECRFFRAATASPCVGKVSFSLPRTPRSRSRSSLHAISPRRSNGRRQSHQMYEKLDVIRSDNDLSDCFRQMGIAGCNSGNNFTSETPLGRHRPRTRPYVPQPRSVIIRAGYLPVVQTVDLIAAGRRCWTTALPRPQDSASGEVCLGGNDIPDSRRKTDELPVLSSSSFSPQEERNASDAVTNEGDHTPKVLKKDVETNTSAEVLVLPKGTKTSVLLKTVEVDGKRGLRRRKKKRGGLRRISRTVGRIMIRVLELF